MLLLPRTFNFINCLRRFFLLKGSGCQAWYETTDSAPRPRGDCRKPTLVKPLQRLPGASVPAFRLYREANKHNCCVPHSSRWLSFVHSILLLQPNHQQRPGARSPSSLTLRRQDSGTRLIGLEFRSTLSSAPLISDLSHRCQPTAASPSNSPWRHHRFLIPRSQGNRRSWPDLKPFGTNSSSSSKTAQSIFALRT